MMGNPKQNLQGLSAKVSKTDKIQVLLAEDDQYCRETLVDELSEHGFSVRSFGDGASLFNSLNTGPEADVIILDWRLQKTSGIALLAQLRRHGVNLPVVFLTGHALTPVQESLAFDRGAIDYIHKARGVDILVRRLKLVVKSATPPTDPRPEELMVCGRLVLGASVSRAYWKEVDVGLTVGQYNIVHLLASNVGRYVTYRAIYDRLHYEGFIARSAEDGHRTNVRAAIRRIRSKFRGYDPTFDEIQNYAAFGYCWGRPDGGG